MYNWRSLLTCNDGVALVVKCATKDLVRVPLQYLAALTSVHIPHPGTFVRTRRQNACALWVEAHLVATHRTSYLTTLACTQTRQPPKDLSYFLIKIYQLAGEDIQGLTWNQRILDTSKQNIFVLCLIIENIHKIWETLWKHWNHRQILWESLIIQICI